MLFVDLPQLAMHKICGNICQLPREPTSFLSPGCVCRYSTRQPICTELVSRIYTLRDTTVGNLHSIKLIYQVKLNCLSPLSLNIGFGIYSIYCSK